MIIENTTRTNTLYRSNAITGFCILLLLFGLSACSSTNKQTTPVTKNSHLFSTYAKQNKTQQQIDRHFQHWKRTPYKLGGTSKRGIDCSGFVQVTYREVFAKTIPRSTELQVKAGKSIPRKNLKFGDLVFFKTGIKQRHVGIYIGSNKFIHASTSKGVMQSRLDSPYWKKHYWTAKRILNT